MRKIPALCCCSGMALIILLLFCSSFRKPVPAAVYFPYKEAGLSASEAAAHLLSRFTYGATPEDVDAALKMGLEEWFLQQLQADQPDEELNGRLQSYDALGLSNTEVCRIYPTGNEIRRMAIRDSFISKDSVDRAENREEFYQLVKAYMDAHGIKPDQEFYRQFINRNLLRAAYTRNQLQAIMTGFWFNHFNVSFSKSEASQFIPAYERDAVTRYALGHFDSLLLATAQSPAMLFYLDNATSVAAGKPKPVPVAVMMEAAAGDTMPRKKPVAVKGLNENYARELMELHTLGVDGGYTQQDVTEAARVLTGWTVYPVSEMGPGAIMKATVDKAGAANLSDKGFVHVNDFLFVPTRHDQETKVVLGHTFTATKDPLAGYQEGLDLIQMVAHHPSTAKFICNKLAVRFVSDHPSKALVAQMVRTFTEHDGDIREVLLTMVSSKEFWDKKNIQAKVKSPFEYAISAIRVLHADIEDPVLLSAWIAKMGERCYYYPAPTGFPDRRQYWINTGTLLSRMNFGIMLASGNLKGVVITPGAFSRTTGLRDSMQVAEQMMYMLLPGRNTTQLLEELTPLLQTRGLAGVQQPDPAPVAQVAAPLQTAEVGAPGDMMTMSAIPDSAQQSRKDVPSPKQTLPRMPVAIAGMIIGSPQFQQR